MRTMTSLAAATLLAVAAFHTAPASAAAKTDCEMRFNLTGWAAIYKHAEGSGTITCPVAAASSGPGASSPSAVTAARPAAYAASHSAARSSAPATP